MNDAELEKMAEQVTALECGPNHPHAAGFYRGVIAGYKKTREWISVKEGLPEGYGMYLVNIINARNSIASFNGEEFSLYHDEAGLESDITHWMPLPAKPEGVE